MDEALPIFNQYTFAEKVIQSHFSARHFASLTDIKINEWIFSVATFYHHLCMLSSLWPCIFSIRGKFYSGKGLCFKFAFQRVYQFQRGISCMWFKNMLMCGKVQISKTMSISKRYLTYVFQEYVSVQSVERSESFLCVFKETEWNIISTFLPLCDRRVLCRVCI